MPDIFDQLASPQNGQSAAPQPSGDVFDQLASSQAAPPPTQSSVPDALRMNQDPTTLSGGLHNIAAGLNSVSTGIVHGALDTIGGGLHIADKLTGTDPTKDKWTSAIDQKKQELDKLGQENPTATAVGKGGESLVEFLMGDEALKGLSFADRLTHAARTAKLLEKSPKMMKAFQIGAEALNTGVRQGAVQAGQTLVKTGGDVGQAAESGALAGVTGGALHGVGGTVGEGLSAAGDAGKKVQELGDVAASSPSKADVGAGLADKINSGRETLMNHYGEKLKDFTERVGDATVPYVDSPFHKAVTDIIGKGEAEADPFDAAIRKSRPGSPRVNQMLEDLKGLGKPPEPVEGSELAATPTTEAPEPIDMNLNKLIEKRQLFRERMAAIKGTTTEDLADKDVYGRLLNGVDDTIDQLAEKSGNPEVIDEYRDLRGNYKDKINLYNDPVVKKLIDPKGSPDDAAKAFIGVVRQSGLPQAGKVQQSLTTLQKVLDPLGTEGDKPLKQFGSQVFGTLLKDAGEGEKFNASRFMDTWSKIDEPTKERLFDAGENSDSVIAQYARDAHSAANVQRLTRVGLLGAGALPFHAPGLGLVGLLALTNENAGVHAGRSLLDFVANHPWTWKALRGAGDVAESPVASSVAKTAEPVLAHEAGQAVTSDDQPYTHVSESGKYGWDGKQWVEIPQGGK